MLVVSKFFYLQTVKGGFQHIMSDASLNIRPFPTSMLSTDDIIVLLGKPETGKSTTVRTLLYAYRNKIEKAKLVSSTAKINHEYDGIFPPSDIHDEYDESIVHELIKEASEVNEPRRLKGLPLKVFALVLDDMGFEKAMTNSKMLSRLFTTNRHYGIMIIICLHYAVSIPPKMRCMISYLFALRQNQQKYIEVIRQEYCDVHKTVFSTLFDSCTPGKGRSMVIHNRSLSSSIPDRVFWFKSRMDLPKFRLGSERVWEEHYKKYPQDRPRANKDEEMYPNKFNREAKLDDVARTDTVQWSTSRKPMYSKINLLKN